MRHARHALLAGLAVALLTDAASASGAFPVNVVDGRERPVTVPARPERVIALSNAAADMLVALGRPPVAVTTYEGRRAEYLGPALANAVDLGDVTTPNLEVMARLDADLTVGLLLYNGPFAEEISAFSTFLAYRSSDLANSHALIASLGRALGEVEAAEAMNARFERLIAEHRAKAPDPGPTYLLLWSFHDTFYALQDNLLAAELLSLIGGRNLAGRAPDAGAAENAFRILEPEALLDLDPEVLLVFASHGGPIKHRALFDRLQSVRADRAYAIGQHYSQPSGPIAREMVLREGAHLLYPAVFDRPDLPSVAQARPLGFAR